MNMATNSHLMPRADEETLTDWIERNARRIRTATPSVLMGIVHEISSESFHAGTREAFRQIKTKL